MSAAEALLLLGDEHKLRFPRPNSSKRWPPKSEPGKRSKKNEIPFDWWSICWRNIVRHINSWTSFIQNINTGHWGVLVSLHNLWWPKAWILMSNLTKTDNTNSASTTTITIIITQAFTKREILFIVARKIWYGFNKVLVMLQQENLVYNFFDFFTKPLRWQHYGSGYRAKW